MKRTNRFVYATSTTALLFVGQVNATIIVDNTGARPSCDSTLVTLAGTAPTAGDAADACVGYFAKPGSKAAETELLNSRTDGEDWSFVYKVAEQETEGPGVFQGISIELTGVDLGRTDGDWTLTWRDTNGDSESNLPLIIDVAAAFKAGTNIAYFIFEAVELSAPLIQGDSLSRQGSFNLQGKHGLSHESLFVRLAAEPDEPPRQPPQSQVPAPNTILLLAASLLGFAARRRRRA